jgi:hypothetical protein
MANSRSCNHQAIVVPCQHERLTTKIRDPRKIQRRKAINTPLSAMHSLPQTASPDHLLNHFKSPLPNSSRKSQVTPTDNFPNQSQCNQHNLHSSPQRQEWRQIKSSRASLSPAQVSLLYHLSKLRADRENLLLNDTVYGVVAYVRSQLIKESATMNRMFAQQNSPRVMDARRRNFLIDSEGDPRKTPYNFLNWSQG